jgi:activating signal cointegrator 1
MKTLTVQQPWAWAIVTGLKRFENRSRRTNYRGPLLIHAGKSQFWLGTPEVPEAPPTENLIRSAIIGGVEVIDCVPVADVYGQRFASGPWCWVLDHPWCLAQPVPMSGKLGLFETPESVVERMQPA